MVQASVVFIRAVIGVGARHVVSQTYRWDGNEDKVETLQVVPRGLQSTEDGGRDEEEQSEDQESNDGQVQQVDAQVAELLLWKSGSKGSKVTS